MCNIFKNLYYYKSIHITECVPWNDVRIGEINVILFVREYYYSRITPKVKIRKVCQFIDKIFTHVINKLLLMFIKKLFS